VFRGFTNFYRRFIRKDAKVTFRLTELLKKADKAGGRPEGRPGCQNSEKCGKVKWKWTQQGEWVFRKLKRTFTDPPILQHFDPAKAMIVQRDVTRFVRAGILNQYDGSGVLRPDKCYSGKCSSGAQNYETYDLELLAIVETLKQCRHYLDSANHKVYIQCCHENLEYFLTSQVLSRRQARWSEVVSAYNFVIEHLEGSKIPGAGQSRLPDYQTGVKAYTRI
jgi:hypothetical protein